MFNIGFSEFLILGIIIIVCVDAKKLPQLARTVGRLVGEFRKIMNQVNLADLTSNTEVGRTLNETRESIKSTIAATADAGKVSSPVKPMPNDEVVASAQSTSAPSIVAPIATAAETPPTSRDLVTSPTNEGDKKS